MNSKLIALGKLLKDQNLKEYLFVLTSINKNLEIKGSENLFNYLEKNDIFLNIDSPKGSMKGFGSKKRRLPFDYGELNGVINPADGMGWDIIFPPSEEPADGRLIPIGIIKVNNDELLWKEKLNMKPPIGNDKIIVSKSGSINEKDKEIINKFFDGMWQFQKIEWF